VYKFVIILAVCIITFSLAGDSYAHKAQVVGDYKIEVGWKNEPPIVGIDNAIEIVVTIATDFDKKRFDKIVPIIKDGTSIPSKSDISGLADKLEVDVKLGGEKTFVTLVESTELPGLYHGQYRPHVAGQPTVRIYGIIRNLEFEVTFNPEKVEEPAEKINYLIPNWIKSNAGWWANGSISDEDFVKGIQYLIEIGIMRV
jgi:hypothetical protein